MRTPRIMKLFIIWCKSGM